MNNKRSCGELVKYLLQLVGGHSQRVYPNTQADTRERGRRGSRSRVGARDATAA
jgi:hypothetical protein